MKLLLVALAATLAALTVTVSASARTTDCTPNRLGIPPAGCPGYPGPYTTNPGSTTPGVPVYDPNTCQATDPATGQVAWTNPNCTPGHQPSGTDWDGDGVPNATDNCPRDWNPHQNLWPGGTCPSTPVNTTAPDPVTVTDEYTLRACAGSSCQTVSGSGTLNTGATLGAIVGLAGITHATLDYAHTGHSSFLHEVIYRLHAKTTWDWTPTGTLSYAATTCNWSDVAATVSNDNCLVQTLGYRDRRGSWSSVVTGQAKSNICLLGILCGHDNISMTTTVYPGGGVQTSGGDS
jgi:hypothetical protein